MTPSPPCTCSRFSNSPDRWCQKHSTPRIRAAKRDASWWRDFALGLYPPIMPPMRVRRRNP